MKKLLLAAAITGLITSVFTSVLSAETRTLYSGQDYAIGTVNIWNDASNIYVDVSLNQIDIDNGWCITETHVHIDSVSEFPLTRSGNPKVGHFEYAMGYECVTEIDPIVIGLGELSADDSANMAVHVGLEQHVLEPVDGELVEVVYMDSAWADGTRFNERGNWATYFSYSVACALGMDGTLTLNVDSVNGNSSYAHLFTLDIQNGSVVGSYGWSFNHGWEETLSNISFDPVNATVSFQSDYTGNTYTFYPAFNLNADGTLTFIDGVGPDNVNAATGTWSYSCSE